MKGAVLLSIFIVVMSVSGTAIYDPNNTHDNSNDEIRTMAQPTSVPEAGNDSQEEVDEDVEITTTRVSEPSLFQKIVQALTSLF